MLNHIPTLSDIWGIYRYTMYVSYMDDAWHCRNKVADSGWFHLRCVSILLCPRPVSALHQSHDPCKVGTKVARSRSQNKPQDSEQSPERQPTAGCTNRWDLHQRLYILELTGFHGFRVTWPTRKTQFDVSWMLYFCTSWLHGQTPAFDNTW